MSSPLGPLLLVGDDVGLCAIHMGEPEAEPGWPDDIEPDPVSLRDMIEQLEAYFIGDLLAFDVPLHPVGTPFQRAVWEAVAAIPYGATSSYAEIAKAVGRPSAFRAVGLANGRNPLPIIVPCHRVIGSSGSLTGYSGGIARKRHLLDLERRTLGRGYQADLGNSDLGLYRSVPNESIMVAPVVPDNDVSGRAVGPGIH
ncbi:methylated-DNA--[protein]-cysteine S-methyltransferase [Protofrankia symbiont of Coriaria ruscifolia]|uniref:Methylated-DNA--protein-cysteine methyltransferase n=1 Tax=Candidatus Protofrankia californiensis TaxID=1839754 RepID=A0A1C3NT78_9ACTN|nr:methylated-DNA--[protein]-cysteine S-methyltransferase [Protofrankia symbiont of Coriaria ruscifolia]SBW17479.1 methylated-DNA-protein-cysteinemethyltransferase [Candidatus Protofrankia californiensis]